MSQEQWSAVDRYYSELIVRPDSVLDSTLEASAAAGLPSISVSACQGKLLMLLAMSIGARRILEIGTLGGYSTIWLARGLPADGSLISLEYEKKHADVARANIEQAGLSRNVNIRVGAALDTLPTLLAEKKGPFDLIFIDADKTGYPDYLPWSLKLARKGSLILADNVVRSGKIADPTSTDATVQAVRRFNQLVAAEPRLSATAIQTVGTKGYDGLMIARVISD